VTCILRGRHYLRPELADQISRALAADNASDAPHETLSPRECEVFLKRALRHTISRIARALNSGVKTVETHQRRVLQKMGMKNTEDLARYAFERRLIPSRRLGDKGANPPGAGEGDQGQGSKQPE
jgi:DNA-binding NarL/FixJ family response regulator